MLSRVLSIVIIDLVLSGDNAVVIGLAARRLTPEQRRLAILWGGLGAIGLRVLFTALAALLLGVPLLQFSGGVVLVWIAYKLLREEATEREIREGDSLLTAVRTIIVADIVMSLDNILAIGGVAHGDLTLLLFGLGLSMPIILFGSNLIAVLTTRLPWLAYVGSGVLAWAAAEMMLHDGRVGQFIPQTDTAIEPFPVVVTLATLVVALLMNRRTARQRARATAPEEALSPRS